MAYANNGSFDEEGFYHPDPALVEEMGRRVGAVAPARQNGHMRAPAATEPPPLPKPGKRPVDHHDRKINPDLDGVAGAEPINLVAIKQEAAAIREALPQAHEGNFSLPNRLYDEILPTLTAAEWMVLSYILRHTIGYQNKADDAISLRQFQKGIKRKEGGMQDKGTGLGRSTIQRALRGLEEKGRIVVTPSTSKSGDPDMNVYHVVL